MVWYGPDHPEASSDTGEATPVCDIPRVPATPDRTQRPIPTGSLLEAAVRTGAQEHSSHGIERQAHYQYGHTEPAEEHG